MEDCFSVFPKQTLKAKDNLFCLLPRSLRMTRFWYTTSFIKEPSEVYVPTLLEKLRVSMLFEVKQIYFLKAHIEL